MGLLRMDLPFEEWHGQQHLKWRPPAYPGDLPEQFLNGAFRKEYEINSSTIYRVVETAVRGYQTLSVLRDDSPIMQSRLETLRSRVLEYAVMLPVIRAHAVNDLERQRAQELDSKIHELIAPLGLKDIALRTAARAFARWWQLRVALKGDVLQPATIFTEFRLSERRKGRFPLPLVEVNPFVPQGVRGLAVDAMVPVSSD